MPESKTIVVGAGLLGLASAWELASRGVSVEILEAREDVGLAASFANGAMLTASMPDPWNAPGVYRHLFASLFDPYSPMKLRPRAIPSLAGWGLQFLANSRRARYDSSTRANFELARYSVCQTEKLRESLGLHYDASATGTMKFFRDERAMAGPIAIAETLAEHGLQYEVLDRNATVIEEPQLGNIRGKIAGALRFRDDRSGDAQLFCAELRKHLENAGATIRFLTPVTDVIIEQGRVAGVLTSGGRTDAGRVVLAAGVWSASLSKSANVRLRIAPAKGYSVTVPRNGLADWPTLPIIDDARHTALVPVGDRLRLVGTAEFAGFDLKIRRARIGSLMSLFREIYPHIADKADLSQSTEWAGLRPMSADGRPFIGQVGPAGFFVNTGHGHLGWTHAVGSARLLVDQMLGKRPEIDATAFRAAR